ncbi:MAG: hypothetical protein Q9206_005359 [Seirophora lacunosa]
MEALLPRSALSVEITWEGFELISEPYENDNAQSYLIDFFKQASTEPDFQKVTASAIDTLPSKVKLFSDRRHVLKALSSRAKIRPMSP